VDTTDDNKDVQLLKDKIWTRQIAIKAEMVFIRKSQVVEKTTLLDEVQRNQMKEQEIQKELEKDNRIVYVEERIYMSKTLFSLYLPN